MLLYSVCVVGQQEQPKGYYLDGEDVVFVFKAKDYKYYTSETYQYRLEASEVFVRTVALSGEFNLWSRDKWQMKKVNKDYFELRMRMADFTEDFDWEFKYVINGDFWAEPSYKDPNIANATEKGKPLHVYNLRMFTAYASEQGNAIFKLKGYKDAENVILSGTFNRWDESLFRMNETNDGWELILQLKPDIYEYKFIVDGNWITDPNNPSKAPNEFHGYNSVINVKVPITFTLTDFKNASHVAVAGDFNDWSKDSHKMEKTEDGWAYTTFLSGGKHHYKFYVDGEWITDPENPVREYDGKGNINSVYMVR